MNHQGQPAEANDREQDPQSDVDDEEENRRGDSSLRQLTQPRKDGARDCRDDVRRATLAWAWRWCEWMAIALGGHLPLF